MRLPEQIRQAYFNPTTMTLIDIALKLASRLHASLDSEAAELLTTILHRQEVHKGETLLEEGQVARNMHFVYKGLIRQYYFKNGIDITEHFASEWDIVYCTDSMLMREPTSLMIEALEDGVVYSIPFEEFQALCEKSQPIMKLYVKLLEDGLLESLHKTDAQRFESARERYENFVRQYPEAARRAPGKHIASYLLMTPESLSRVRAGLL